MNASEAKKITEKNLKDVIITPYLDIIYGKIKIAAEKGENQITHPFHGVRIAYPSTEAQEKIWIELMLQGYKVKHYDDPDPGHPASSPYTQISW